MSRHHDLPALGGFVRGALATVVLCGTTVGCQSHSDPGSASGGSAGNSSGAESTQAPSPVDACSMVSPQDISSLLGASVQGKSTTHNTRRSGCTWENSTTDESVTVEIGLPDSAPHNTLKAALPGFPDRPAPDGMRYVEFGAIRFAAGNRENTVQVAVIRLTGDQRDAAAVDLARKILPKFT